MDVDKQRKLIAEELAKDEPNWSVIESLSRGIVDNNPDRVRFSVDAAHIQRLGAELVGKQDTALAELIKNAYDADATTVRLTFERRACAGGVLTIEDNGVGMVESVIRSSWMRISTTEKIYSPVSALYGRIRAGRKGIGRFAVQRLGKVLTLESRPRGEVLGLRVEFDWDRDFTEGLNLIDVFSRIERFDRSGQEDGTTLRINDLRDPWSDASLQRVWRSILLLQPPYRIEDKESGQSQVRDPGFKVSINGASYDRNNELFSIEKSFLSYAIGTIEASIDDKGIANVRVISEKLGLDDSQILDGKFLLTGALSLSSRYFIYHASVMSGAAVSVASEMGRTFGGIRIYRNGFRVLPYGEPSDDWLSLDVDASRRLFLFPANNRNFFGEIVISAEENPLFEETSSREGLIENEAYAELVAFGRAAIEWAAKRIAAVRNRKQTAGQKGFTPSVKKPSELLRSLREKIGSDGQSSERWASTEEAIAEAEAAAELYEESVAAQRAAALEYEQMLRLLASLGLSISVFGHEVKGARDAMLARLDVLSDLSRPDGPEPDRATLARHLEALSRSSGRLFDLGGYIAGLMSSTESRELRELSVLGSVNRFVQQFSDYMTRQGVSFEVDVSPQSLRTALMHSSEFDSVLLNFLTNSIKSMKRAKVSARRVKIDARLDGKFALIGFEDNGFGVPVDVGARVFDAFFTTTAAAEDDGVAGPGTGLGLKIVADIAESYGGSAVLGTPSPGYSCRFEFRVLASGN